MSNVADLSVRLIGWTQIDSDLMHELTGWNTDAAGGQALAEFAGRACYQSWSKPNPITATNKGYLARILKQQHESVLEHAVATFYVTGVSRSLLTELERHRHVSLSVLSQRYVDESDASIIIPPSIKLISQSALLSLSDVAERVLISYKHIVKTLTDLGLSRKRAREAARAVLPNMTETKFVVTANVRAWRDLLKKRWHEAADLEILAFSEIILNELNRLVPNMMQDFPTKPFGYDDVTL